MDCDPPPHSVGKREVKMPFDGGCPWRCMMVCNTEHPHNKSLRRHSHEQHHHHIWTLQHSSNAHTCTSATTPLDSHPIFHPTCGQQTKSGKPPTTSNPHLNTHQNQHIQTRKLQEWFLQHDVFTHSISSDKGIGDF